MAVISFTEKLKLEQGTSLMLYRGLDGFGEPFFAYIECNKQGIERMAYDYKTNRSGVDISEYGNVVYMDFKAEPDAKAHTYLEQYYKRLAEAA